MRELLKLDFQRQFNGIMFKIAVGVCAVFGIWDLVLNVQAHNANMEALQTQTIAYSYCIMNLSFHQINDNLAA